MGGEETEIGERRRTCCSRRRTSSRSASSSPPSGSGCAPRARTAGRRASTRTSRAAAANLATELLLELAGGAWSADADVHGALPERPRRPLPHRAGRRGDRDRDAARRAAARSSSGSASTSRRRDVVVPTWRARDVTREIDVVEEIARFRLEDVPFTLPPRRAMFGALTRSQRLRRRVEDALVGLGLRRDLHAVAPPGRPGRRRAAAAGAALGRARGRCARGCCRASSRRRGATSSSAPRRSRCSRSRASTSPGGDLPDERLHVAGVVEGGFAPREGRRRDAPRRAQGRAAVRARRATSCSTRARRRAPPPASSASCTRRCSRARGACSSSTSSGCSPRRATTSSSSTSSPSRPCARTSRSSSPRTCRPATSSTRCARRPGDELREVRPFDVYRGPQVGDGRKSVAFAVSLPVARADARRRGRRAAARCDRRRARARFGAELRT